MSTNAQKGCGRGENKYVKEIHFLHSTRTHSPVLTVWNSLPDSLCDPAVESKSFRLDLKTYLHAGH